MDEFLFISETFLKDNSMINDNVDFKNLRSTIITAQDIHLEAILGTALYEDLVAKGIANTFNADELVLIRKYIQKVMIWYTIMESTPEFKLKYMNKGIMIKSSDNSQSGTQEDIRFLESRAKIKSEIYAEKLTKYLLNNNSKFPKYDEFSISGTNPNRNNYTLGIYLDNYEQSEWTKDNQGTC